MTHYLRQPHPLHPGTSAKRTAPQINDYTDVRTYFEVAQSLGNPYGSAVNVRADLLSALRAPIDARLSQRCIDLAQRLASTARERRKENYWWSSVTLQTSSYRMIDLDRQQDHQELIGSLLEQCAVFTGEALLSDLAPAMAMMAMDLLRLAAALDRFIPQSERSKLDAP